ncbi:MAG: phenylalanine--tRNA ligase subunit beta, partial [Candidatus Aenigmarchaeota archaeon]|nr:phenylalanine--tRNA ligase subunit beta [Candidatus Aenigmarchaeota archaeon]
VDVEYVNKISGLKLTSSEICKLLEKARYDVKLKGNRIEVLYPAYRQDIMHPRDIVEDVIISYGYNRIEPIIPKIYTVGKADEKIFLVEKVSEVMVGLGFQEILSYTLTNKENLFRKMNLEVGEVVEIENPISAKWSVFRDKLLPGLLEFLSYNKHVEYPQKIFEVGNIVLLDMKTETRARDCLKLVCCISDAKVSYEEISSLLDAFFSMFGVDYKLKGVKHPSFIEGRVAEVLVGETSFGIIGEISPLVLNNWNLSMPVVAFEIEIEKLLKK